MMFYTILPLLLTVVGASPIYIGTSLPLEGYGANLHHLAQASLLTQPLAMLYQYGNLDQLGTLSKGLLSSHLGGQISKLSSPIIHPATGLGLISPELHHIPYPIKKEMMFPEKKIAGALIKQIPKVSKLPISVSYSPKSLEFSPLAQSGILEGGLTGGLTGGSILPGKSLISGLGLSYGF